MNITRRTLFLCAVGFTLAACQTLPETPVDDAMDDMAEEVAEPVTPAEPPAPIVYGNFTKDQLNRTILNELGGQRGHLPEAAEDYYSLAIETRDLSIIRRAAQFAAATNDGPRVVELSRLWIERDPSAQEPHLLIAYQLLEQGRMEEAMRHIGEVLALGGNVDFTTITSRTQYLPPQARNQLIESFLELHAQFPERRAVHYSLIQLLEQSDRAEEAMTQLLEYRERHGNSSRIMLLQAQLLLKLGRVDDAVGVLAAGIEAYPENRLLRFNYGRILVQTERLVEAREQFALLAVMAPDDNETLYSLALLDLELNAPDSAKTLLNKLLQANYRVNEAHYYLGYIGQTEGTNAEAIEHFKQVGTDYVNYLNAQRQAIRLMVEEGELEAAHEWVSTVAAGNPELELMLVSVETDALMNAGHQELAETLLSTNIEKHPGNVDLLFARALLSEQMGDMAKSEADLRRIIELQPTDARALNHLGYTLADRTTRYDEALGLLQRAIAASPEDPAIIDSLGWVLFKLGRYEESLSNLQKAFEVFPDPEVAAHLGEVLWVMGRQRDANRIWDASLRDNPGSDILLRTIERLRSRQGS
ncbi:MAG: tetratricopeptide repeat protein [Pseudomonadales bacterium]|nr:tetratricopeptide repeat protein [Pseudomonadales bacterium]MCP5358414.1 tetratricopeptide repeat protein [Pseudomonadales bacterium]